MLKKFISGIIIFVFVFCIQINHTYALTPASNLSYQGIDVSNWQGYINYAEVRDAGIQVVYIKASQGTNIKDAYFDINYENAKENGLRVGFYHYLTATSTEQAREEANYFVSVISLSLFNSYKHRTSERRSKLFCICHFWKNTRL